MFDDEGARPDPGEIVFDIKILDQFPNRMFRIFLIECAGSRTVLELISSCNQTSRDCSRRERESRELETGITDTIKQLSDDISQSNWSSLSTDCSHLRDNNIIQILIYLDNFFHHTTVAA